LKRPLFWTGAVFLSQTAAFLRLPLLIALLCCLFIITFSVFLSRFPLKTGVIVFAGAALVSSFWLAGYNGIYDRFVSPLCSDDTKIYLTVLTSKSGSGYYSYSGRATLEKDGRSCTLNGVTVYIFSDLGTVPRKTLGFNATVELDRGDNSLSRESYFYIIKSRFRCPAAFHPIP
jgi:hypothetical protein